MFSGEQFLGEGCPGVPMTRKSRDARFVSQKEEHGGHGAPLPKRDNEERVKSFFKFCLEAGMIVAKSRGLAIRNPGQGG
jgi:hypothetical protein